MPSKHRDGRKQYGLRMEPEEHAMMMEAARIYDMPADELVLMAVKEYARRVGLSAATNGDQGNGSVHDDDIAIRARRARGGGDRNESGDTA